MVTCDNWEGKCVETGTTALKITNKHSYSWKTTLYARISFSSYSNLAEKNFPSCIQGIKMWSLCQSVRLSIFSSGIHSSLPSGESISSPQKSLAVKTKTYQSLPLN